MATTHFVSTDAPAAFGFNPTGNKAFVYDDGGATLSQAQVYAYLLTVPLVAYGPMYSGAKGRASGTRIYGHQTADTGTILVGTAVQVR